MSENRKSTVFIKCCIGKIRNKNFGLGYVGQKTYQKGCSKKWIDHKLWKNDNAFVKFELSWNRQGWRRRG